MVSAYDSIKIPHNDPLGQSLRLRHATFAEPDPVGLFCNPRSVLEDQELFRTFAPITWVSHRILSASQDLYEVLVFV